MKLQQISEGVSVDLDCIQAIIADGATCEVVIDGETYKSSMSYSSMIRLVDGVSKVRGEKRDFRHFKDELIDIQRQILAGQTTTRP